MQRKQSVKIKIEFFLPDGVIVSKFIESLRYMVKIFFLSRFDNAKILNIEEVEVGGCL